MRITCLSHRSLSRAERSASCRRRCDRYAQPHDSLRRAREGGPTSRGRLGGNAYRQDRERETIVAATRDRARICSPSRSESVYCV